MSERVKEIKPNSICIKENLKNLLPITYDILNKANLVVHPYVYKIVLSGSRGLSNYFREDSDIDLSLLVDSKLLDSEVNKERVLKEILDVTLNNWKGRAELDTVAVFDICGCKLACFNYEFYSDKICKDGGTDCLGLYKIQKGFCGLVPKIGISISLIHPIITVWEREKKGEF